MSISIKDVARAAKLSTATVSLALNGSEKINPKTRKKVEEIAKEMGYKPNPYARQLVTKRSRQIGLIVPDIENVYYASLAQAVFNDLSMSGYGLSISVSMNSRLTERKIVSDMIANRMDGIILAPVNVKNDNTDYLDLVKDAGIPLLFLTSTYPKRDEPHVMCDLYSGMKALLNELYQNGYRKIELLSGADGVFALSLRDNGYLDFIKEKKLDHNKIHRLDHVGYNEAQKLIEGMTDITADAFVCVNDMMALGVINALREKGYSIPGDIAVAGYDDVIFSDISPVPITTVKQDIKELSSIGVNTMLDMIEGKKSEIKSILINCEPVIKGSTAGKG